VYLVFFFLYLELVLIVNSVLSVFRALWHFHEPVGHAIKKPKKGQALLTFLCKALLTFLLFVGFSVRLPWHMPPGPKITRGIEIRPDGPTAPELSLLWLPRLPNA
jgi:hypothetical protein